ncbi:MAG TPA: FAD-dependent monooxygenase [Hellea balneolensis]|uniref:FAD-dependent monooxygenase n=1 Tax=Hellea balneolensis TaxID=287478 RepID=A0A7C3FZB1_9PROT|nr:FAD-dependent monooxygenase [Hellea balneolensis]
MLRKKVECMNVLVIGAGPTGLTAALALASRGISCRIVERRTEPSKLSRAVGIMPTTVDIFHSLGAADALLSEAMKLRKIHLTRSGKTLMLLDTSESTNSNRMMVGLPQNRTEEILRDVLHARKVYVDYGLSVEKISTDNQAASVTFSDQTTDIYDWVIAADGLHSTTREQLGIDYPGYDLPGEWSIADVDVAGVFDPKIVRIDVQEPGNNFLMILPIEARRVRIVSSTPDALAAMTLPLDIENVRRTGVFHMSIRQAETYHKGRVLLAGDAAHSHSPVGGKGMNLGIADAVAAVAAIVDGTVENYTHERHQIGASILKKTEVVRKIITSNSFFSKTFLGFAAKLVVSVPIVRRMFMKNLTEL